MHYNLPKVDIQEVLEVGDIIRIGEKRYMLESKHDNYGRFIDEGGFFECFTWWDVQRIVRNGKVPDRRR